MAHIILFENINFHGAHRHVVHDEPNLNASDDNFFNDRVSSLAILEGNWACYPDANFRGKPYPNILGPGLYPNVTAVKIKNDDMSSLLPVATAPNVHGDPFDNHILLFENANYHGAHKHVFTREPNLNASDDNFFNDRVSSLAIFQGNWRFYANSGFAKPPYPPVLGPVTDNVSGQRSPGGYPFVPNVGIKNDDMSSLEPVDDRPTVRNPERLQEGVILFENANFHGAHKHVLKGEPNLNAPDDNFFNDKVSSLAILSGQWEFWSDANFKPDNRGVVLNKNIYSFVGDVGIKNDDISSLRPLV
jgi:hypothetical protein